MLFSAFLKFRCVNPRPKTQKRQNVPFCASDEHVRTCCDTEMACDALTGMKKVLDIALDMWYYVYVEGEILQTKGDWL